MKRLLGSCAAACLVLPLCLATSAGAQRAPAQLSAGDVTAYASVLRAADARALDTAAIDAALRSPGSVVRTAGARALAQIAPTRRARAIPLLRVLLGARDPGVVTYAAFGLGLAHDTAAVPQIARVVGTTRDTAVARAAAWSLGEIGTPAAAALDSLLATRLPASSERFTLLAASRVPTLPTARFVRFLSALDPSVRWAAAYAIARPHRSGGAAALLSLRDQPPPVRAEIARALTASAVGDLLTDSAILRLRQLAHDPDPAVRVVAVRSLATFGAPARTALAAAVRDPDAQVRVAAAQSVARAYARASAWWSDAWLADSSYRFRRSLLESAAAAGVMLPAAAQWMHAADWRMRAAAVGAQATPSDTAGAIALALAATRDTDPRVRGAAYGTLATLDSAARDPRVRAAFDAARTEPDTIARNAVPGLRDTTAHSAPAPQPLAWYEHVVRTIVVPALDGRAARAVLATERGPITITLYGGDTPLTVWNFATLARRRFYDGLRFHRVVPAFVAQDGDPRGDGAGGPPYTIRDELTPLPYARGAVGMALSGPDTGGSQYFLTLTPQPHLDGRYTVFGMVVSGGRALDALREGDLIRTVRISNFDPR